MHVGKVSCLHGLPHNLDVPFCTLSEWTIRSGPPPSFCRHHVLWLAQTSMLDWIRAYACGMLVVGGLDRCVLDDSFSCGWLCTAQKKGLFPKPGLCCYYGPTDSRYRVSPFSTLLGIAYLRCLLADDFLPLPPLTRHRSQVKERRHCARFLWLNSTSQRSCVLTCYGSFCAVSLPASARLPSLESILLGRPA